LSRKGKKNPCIFKGKERQGVFRAQEGILGGSGQVNHYLLLSKKKGKKMTVGTKKGST